MNAVLSSVSQSNGNRHTKALQASLPDHEPLAYWYESEWDPRLAEPQLKKLAEGHPGETMFGHDGVKSIIISNNPGVQTFLRQEKVTDIDTLSERPEGQAYERNQKVKCGDITYACF